MIFEKHFKRNFIHVRDVADCFVHCLANGAAMAGRAYNAGLDAANLSKDELALAGQEAGAELPRRVLGDRQRIPTSETTWCRTSACATAGFEARRSLDDGIAELLRAYRMLPLGALRNA